MKFIRSPLVWLVSVVLLLGIRDLYFSYEGIWPVGDESLESVLMYFSVACWVVRDSKNRGIYFPSDWVFLATVVFFPVYLFQTRRFSGLFIMACWVATLFCFRWAVWELGEVIWGMGFNS